MHWPPLVINLKQHVVGKKVADYCATIASLTAQYDVPIVICPPIADLDKAHRALEKAPHRILLFCQKIDNVSAGDSATGSVCADSLVGVADGTLLNHYEARVFGTGSSSERLNDLLATIKKAAEKKLTMIVCVDGAETAARIAPFLPDKCAIAVEWDEFIGQRISMIREKKDELAKAIDTVKKINPAIPVYAGAGIEEADDVTEFLRMGGAGVLAATAFTKAPKYGRDYALAVEEVMKRLQETKQYKREQQFSTEDEKRAFGGHPLL